MDTGTMRPAGHESRALFHVSARVVLSATALALLVAGTAAFTGRPALLESMAQGEVAEVALLIVAASAAASAVLVVVMAASALAEAVLPQCHLDPPLLRLP